NRLIGSAGVDHLYGGGGDDFLDGGSGADDLHGEGGNDTLIAPWYASQLTGGSGADAFVFLVASDNPITDFSTAQGDKINLSSIDANAEQDGNQAFQFLGTQAANSAISTPGFLWLEPFQGQWLLIGV